MGAQLLGGAGGRIGIAASAAGAWARSPGGEASAPPSNSRRAAFFFRPPAHLNEFARRGPKKKAPRWGRSCSVELAEEEGFEPPDLLQSTVFKTVAIDHSAILPGQRYTRYLRMQ